MKYLLIALLFVWRPCMGQERHFTVTRFEVFENLGIVIHGYFKTDSFDRRVVWVDSKLYKHDNGWHWDSHGGNLIGFEDKKEIIGQCVQYIGTVDDTQERRNDCLILDKIMQRINHG